MSTTNLPTTYKFKIANVLFYVNSGDFHAFEAGAREKHNSVLSVFHYHAVHELLLVGREPLRICTAEKKQGYTDCVVFVPSFLEHSTRGTIQMRLLFSFEKTDARHTDFSDFIESACGSGAPFAAQSCSAIDFYQEEFLKLSQSNSELCNDMAASALMLIFYHIYEQQKQEKKAARSVKKTPSSGVRDSYIIKIDTLVNDYQNPITLKTVADALCLSTKQTSRIIKKNYNKTLSELIAERRLRVAAALLTEDMYSVSEIVQMVHFSSERYFYYQFKKRFGCTPLEYRLMHIKAPR